MRRTLTLLLTTSFAACGASSWHWYKHKSEAQLARLTPAQLVDEFAEEETHHKYNMEEGLEQYNLIGKYIFRDNAAALPRVIEIIDAYDPTTAAGRGEERGLRYDGAWMLLSEMDSNSFRVRGTEAGRRAIAALERAAERMRAAGFAKKPYGEWELSRLEFALQVADRAKGLGNADETIKNTFRLRYKIVLSDEELLAFSNFLAAKYPEYPGWSSFTLIKDYTQINEAGYPLQIFT